MEELMDGLAQASFAVAAVLTRTAAEYDLSLTQLRVLAILRNHEPTMAELADYLGLERSSVSGLIDRAAKRGLIEKRTHERDGRSVTLRLTDQARELAPELTSSIQRDLEPLASRLTAAEKRRLAELLGKLVATRGR